MSEALLIAIFTTVGGVAGVVIKAWFDGLSGRRDLLWEQLQTALRRLDELDKRHDELLMKNGELLAKVARLESELETERRRSGQLERHVATLKDENIILRRTLAAHGIPVEPNPIS